ncbi:MAG: tetratricopeptide repeat protein [Candidatus Methylumidiphilus sp.]
MSEFHFLRPLWLLALIPFVWLSWRLFRSGRAGGDWRRVCDAELLPFMLVHDGDGLPGRRASLGFGVGGLLAIVALAGPVWERVPAPAFRNDAALVIALDLSKAMDAGDIKPSRVERARFKIADIMKQRKDGLSALLVYAGAAFTVTPLTDDAATITAQLSALATDLMPAQGNRADLALEQAGRLLQQAGLTQGDVLLITPGGGLDKAGDAAQALRKRGYRVSVLGAGSAEGAPVPLAEGGFLQDAQGNIVISKLATAQLRQLAEQGGGTYQALDSGNGDIAALLRFFSRQAQPGGEGGATVPGTTVEQWEERGPWLLLALLPIAALAFRRGVLVAMVLLVLPLPRPAQALSWEDLWQTPDQRASQAFAAGEHKQAAETFADPAWKASAQYKAGQYEEAAQAWEGIASADAHYNRGNALAKQGHYPEALAAYGEALKLDPNNADARHNQAEVEKALQEQQKKQQPDNKKKDQGQQHDKKDGQKQDGEKPKPGEEGQQQNKDGEQPQDQQEGQDGQQQQSGEDQKGQQQQDEKNAKEQAAQRAAAGKPEPEKSEGEPAAGTDARQSEAQQADEQWLRRIPDDPGGLLRRKFLYQYQQRPGRTRTAP